MNIGQKDMLALGTMENPNELYAPKSERFLPDPVRTLLPFKVWTKLVIKVLWIICQNPDHLVTDCNTLLPARTIKLGNLVPIKFETDPLAYSFVRL